MKDYHSNAEHKAQWLRRRLVALVLTIGILYVLRKPHHDEFTQFTSNQAAHRLVEDRVARKPTFKQATNSERDAFQKEGWTLVNEVAPEIEVVELSVSALKEHEPAIQVQLASNTYTRDKLAQVRDLALEATNSKTRYLALENLSRSPDHTAQEYLVECFERLSHQDARTAILGWLKPESLHDNITNFLIKALQDDTNSDEQKQRAFSGILAIGIASNRSELSSLPEPWAEAYSTKYRMLASQKEIH